MSDGLEKELAEFETGFNETVPPEPAESAPESAPSAPGPGPTESPDRQPSDAGKAAARPEVAHATDLAPEPILGEPVDVLSQTITLPDNPSLYGKLAGKKVTKQELLESGHLDKILTREHQELYAQELYKQALEQNRTLRAELEARMGGRPEQAAPAPGQQPELSPEYVKAQAEKIEHEMLPLAKKFAEMGGVEDDFVELYPKMATNYAHQVASQAQLNQFMMRTLQNVVRWVGQKHTGDMVDRSQHTFGGEVAQLVQRGDLFQPLGTDEGREAFVDWLTADDNPLPYKEMDFDKFNSRVIESAYYDFLRSPAGRKFHPASRTTAGKPSRAMLAGSGGGTGGRAGRSPGGPPMSELEKLEKEYLSATDHD